MTELTDQEKQQAQSRAPEAGKALVAKGALFGVAPSTFDQAWRLSGMIARSDVCPKDFRGKQESVMVAIQMGMEIGLAPLAALQNIAVINGRPSLWGDALVGLCLAHPEMEWIDSTFDDETMTATCEVKRRGHPLLVSKFSKEDAEIAGLWGKDVWAKYPKRMLANRARAFALRDKFADGLRGIGSAEEQHDIEIIDGEWSAGDETETTGLDSSKMIQEALAGGEEPEEQGKGDGEPGQKSTSTEPTEAEIAEKLAAEKKDPPQEIAPKEPAKKKSGRPSNLDTFKAEVSAAKDVKAWWEDNRRRYQGKLGEADFQKLMNHAEGLEFEQANPAEPKK